MEVKGFSNVSASDAPLHAGDCVLLFTDHAVGSSSLGGACCLSSCGFSHNRLSVTRLKDDVPTHQRDGIFRICMKLDYQVAKNLSKLDRGGTRLDIDTEEDLKRRAEMEMQKNEDSIKHLAEANLPIYYGQVIQLQHVKSGSFLTLVPRQIADIAQTCMKIELDSSGSAGSWFKIHPRFKSRSEGAQVFHFDQGKGEMHSRPCS